MSKLWAVSTINWNDNDLVTEFHLASTWKQALRLHSTYSDHDNEDDTNEWFANMPADKKKAKQYVFDDDGTFECVEVPTNGESQ